MNINFKLLLFCLLISSVNRTFSQSSEGNFYAFKADWTPAKSIDDCTYFMQETKKSDTEYICRYYYKTGPMIKQEAYKDAQLSIAHGRFCWYNEKGNIDSCGLVRNFKKDGRWLYFFGDSANPTYYQDYDNGKFLKQSSLKNNETTDDDAIVKEATFKNGTKGWLKYLEQNLITPERLKTLGRGRYVITVCFLVDKQGKVQDVYLRKSVEWSADAEIFSIMQKTPAWSPATENGEPVDYRQLQNIVYAVN